MEQDAARILLVEDEPFLRELASESLTEAGYQVITAADGDDGLAVLRSAASIDVLVSDIRLPGPSGYELATAGHELRPAMKVVLMTGYAQGLPASLENVVHRVLQKPFPIDLLPQAVAAAIGGATSTA